MLNAILWTTFIILGFMTGIWQLLAYILLRVMSFVQSLVDRWVFKEPF